MADKEKDTNCLNVKWLGREILRKRMFWNIINEVCDILYIY